jgi:catechol 2,3-dioxygenase-like lactoylglutathione lyase family enzyme
VTSTDASSAVSRPADAVDLKLEVVTVPVADVDAAKEFYLRLGWRLDADIVAGQNFRVVQFTPTHSPCSVAFGKGLTTGEPGSVQRLILAVDDVDAARADLRRRGVEVSELFHLDGGRAPGRDPQGRSYQTYAAFSDPDGNEWLLQEITSRLPGRVWDDTAQIEELAGLLHETADHHDPYEKSHPPHNWWDWYAAYLNARQNGSSSDEAARAAGQFMAEVRHVTAGQSGA